MIKNGGIIGPQNLPSQTSATGFAPVSISGIYDSFQAYNHVRQATWPQQIRANWTSVTPSVTPTEGTAFTVKINLSKATAGLTLHYTIVSLTGSVLAADFTDGLMTGTFTTYSEWGTTSSGEFTKTLVSSDGIETDSFYIEIRLANSSGRLLATTSTITPVDFASIIPTANLYSHYDWSMITGTSWTTSGLMSSGGTAIGLSSTTPAISAVVTSASLAITTGTTTSGKKYLVFPAVTGLSTGSSVLSAGGAYPDITSAGYSFFEVRRLTSAITSAYRTSHWKLNGFGYNFNGAAFVDNSTGTTNDVFAINYAASARYQTIFTDVSRGTLNVVQSYVVTIIGNQFWYYMCIGNTTVYTGGTMTLGNGTQTYGTMDLSYRVFEFHGYPAALPIPSMHAMEHGFYSVPLSNTQASAAALALYNKWA